MLDAEPTNHSLDRATLRSVANHQQMHIVGRLRQRGNRESRSLARFESTNPKELTSLCGRFE